MPLVRHIPLPTFDSLSDQGQEVLTLSRALKQDIRELHIGLLNMMPDAALRVTEQQFMRLIGNSNQIAQLYVHPFQIPGLRRAGSAKRYVEQYYETFAKMKEEGLDALVITGANPQFPTLDQEPFWEPLQQVIAWAFENVTSVLCSCLATHALVKYLYGIERQPLAKKKWGVYSHRIAPNGHPLLRGINTRFDVPHSRYNEVTRAQLEAAELKILVATPEDDIHVATSPDQFRLVFFQGHPEYDFNSLLKEYKREVTRFAEGERPDYPPHPENYFSREAAALADAHQVAVLQAKARRQPVPEFPEAAIAHHLDNTWGDTGKALFNNWLGLVYQLTDLDRKTAFCPGIDPDDPLGMNSLAQKE